MSAAKRWAQLRRDRVDLLASLMTIIGLLPHDPDAAAVEWCSFRIRVLAHFAVEEREVLPHLMLVDIRTAVAMQREHDLLRTRLTQVADALLEGRDTRVLLSALAAELGAHMSHEDSIAEPSRW